MARIGGGARALRQVQALSKGDVGTVGQEWVSHTEPHIEDCGACDKPHSTALARERWGSPIWSAFKYDIRTSVM